jgi:hypothetical protein
MFEKLKEKYLDTVMDCVGDKKYRSARYDLISQHIKASLDQMTWREFIEDIKCNNMLGILSSEDIMGLYRDHKTSKITYEEAWYSTGLPYESIDDPEFVIYKVADRFFRLEFSNICEVKLVKKTITTWETV